MDEILIEFSSFIEKFFAGSPCLTSKGEPGTCKVIRECDPIVKAIQQDKSFKPFICDLITRTICCPIPVQQKATQPPVVSNRISGQSKFHCW